MERNLKNIRKQRGLTQRELAEKAGISRITIARYETGVTTPGSINLFRLAKALECTAEEIMMQKAG